MISILVVGNVSTKKVLKYSESHFFTKKMLLNYFSYINRKATNINSPAFINDYSELENTNIFIFCRYNVIYRLRTALTSLVKMTSFCH